MTTFVVAGTDTGIGKTVFSAGLARLLNATYWKPVQAGLEEETDTETVARLSEVPCLPEAYRLRLPASPHLAAAAEGIEISRARLKLPQGQSLVVETAGGLMVPLTPDLLFLDIIAAWRCPVVLCARTALGTINHSLLSLAALRAAGCDVVGIAFIGSPEPEVEATISHLGATRRLGRLPMLDSLSPSTLYQAFEQAFLRADFSNTETPQ
jgi:dethiobiotin synthetase